MVCRPNWAHYLSCKKSFVGTRHTCLLTCGLWRAVAALLPQWQSRVALLDTTGATNPTIVMIQPFVEKNCQSLIWSINQLSAFVFLVECVFSFSCLLYQCGSFARLYILTSYLNYCSCLIAGFLKSCVRLSLSHSIRYTVAWSLSFLKHCSHYVPPPVKNLQWLPISYSISL